MSRAHGRLVTTPMFLPGRIETRPPTGIDALLLSRGNGGSFHRPFFLAGIAVVLTAGSVWGTALLWRIAAAGAFTGVGIHEVNAHGMAQVYGWVGLFIMGFSYQGLPRLWNTTLAFPKLAAVALASMLAGLATAATGLVSAGESWALPVATAGNALCVGSALLFATQMAVTFARSHAPLEPYVGFVFAAIACFVLQSLFHLWHTWTTLSATTRPELLWHVATYQAPLRDLQVHGMAMLMILGVCQRILPDVFDVPHVQPRRAWRALAILLLAVAGECVIFIAYRFTGNHRVAALLMVPWLMLPIGAWLVAGIWRPWRGLQSRSGKPDVSAPFIRAAFAWLALSLAMLLLLPAYQAALGTPFSHAYYGAIRHAITVGFVSMMIMGFAARLAALFAGVGPAGLTLAGPFLLINLGCLLRVSLQTLTDWHEGFFLAIGVSGMLEVAALAWWGLALVRLLRRPVEPMPQTALVA